MSAVVDIKQTIDNLTETVIGCAIEVHRALGPGLLETVYENALAVELRGQGVDFEQQKRLPVFYREKMVGEFIIDLLVANKLVIELKSVERHDPVFEAQLLTYMKLGGIRTGLLINFNKRLLKDGIIRRVL